MGGVIRERSSDSDSTGWWASIAFTSLNDLAEYSRFYAFHDGFGCGCSTKSFHVTVPTAPPQPELLWPLRILASLPLLEPGITCRDEPPSSEYSLSL